MRHDSAVTRGLLSYANVAGIFAAPPEGGEVDATENPAVKAAIEKLNKVFADYRAATDERFDELAKLGNETPEMKAKLEKADKDLDEVRNSVDELMQQVGRLGVNGAGGEDDGRDILAEAQRFYAGMKGVDEYPIGDAEVEAFAEYDKVFATFLKKGDNAANIKAALSVGSDGNEQWIPTQMQSTIIRRLFETSPMRAICDVISIPTDSVTWPNDTNDATSGGFVGETESRAATATPDVGEQTIYVREQYAMPEVYQKFLDMATIDVGAWLENKIADKLSRVENARFVSGTGVKAPRGFLDYKTDSVTTDDASRSWGVLQHVTSGASAGFPNVSGSSASDPDKLVDLVAKLKPAYRQGARWLMNRATEAALRKLKDADGNYFVGRLTESATGFDILGYPITTAEDMPDLASDSFSVAFGNWMMGYQIVDGRGMRVLRDPYTTKGKVKFYTTKWTGGDVINFDAIKLMKFAA